MPDIETFFDAIDSARARRVRELSEIKHSFSSTEKSDPYAVRSKAVVVLTYANWEGFYNECVEIYFDFLKSCGSKITDVNWLLLVGALTSDLQALRDRNHSNEATDDFVNKLKTRMECDFSQFDMTVVSSRSNLNFENLRRNLDLMAFNYDRLQPSRLKLDKELVGWRHSVAHGDPPDLSTMNVAAHVEFTSNLMLRVSDLFQEAILKAA